MTLSIKKENYLYILRKSKYGGGIPIKIERNCNQNNNCNEIVNGHLYLRTKNFYILYDYQNDKIF